MVRTGLENFIQSPPRWIAGHRLGLLCNQASTDHLYRHARQLISERFPGVLTALYSPQHGFFGDKQDNMIESDHMRDPMLNIPVFSLYGETRRPDEAMLDPIDTLVVDLQDAGTRVYTFIYTMSYCMEAAARYRKRVLLLDRPNPITGIMTEGNCLKSDCASFVGRYPLPMRHGLTIGELALLFNEHFAVGCDLEVVPMTGWKRRMYFCDTGLPWIPPSPNLPTAISAMVYPGQVLWEGTNVSEGRGTTQPFELFGAPWVDTPGILSRIGAEVPEGAVLRQAAFEPTSNKWAGRTCHGFQIHITDPYLYRPYLTTLALIRALLQDGGEDFRWKPPPYEYEFSKLPFDLIAGEKKIRNRLEAFEDPKDMARSWQDDIEAFNRTARRYHLYT